MNLFSHFALFRRKELSPNHIGIHSANSHGYVDLSNQFLDCYKSIHKFIKCDFSNSSFMDSNAIYWIKDKTAVEIIQQNATQEI